MEDMVLCWLWERYLALQRFCCHEDGLFSEEETERGTQEGDTGLLEEGLVGYGCCLAVIGLGEVYSAAGTVLWSLLHSAS
jgi:hypothetical protein